MFFCTDSTTLVIAAHTCRQRIRAIAKGIFAREMTGMRLAGIEGRGAREPGDLNVVVRVKWKPVYARLSSRVNPDHSSIVPQTGDPRPFQPFRPPMPSTPFLACSPTGKPVSLERAYFLRAIEIDGARTEDVSLPHVPLDYYG